MKNVHGWDIGLSDAQNYINICDEIVKNDEIFSNFKSIEYYNSILEHVHYELGEKYFNHIQEVGKEIYDEYFDNWYEGLSDPYYFLVEEQGMYDAESFANANFVRIDFEKLADALEQDYTFIYDGGSLYVFNIR
jgi:hypothetical protein